VKVWVGFVLSQEFLLCLLVTSLQEYLKELPIAFVSKLQTFILTGCFLSRSKTTCGSPFYYLGDFFRNSTSMLYGICSLLVLENSFVFMHIPHCKSRQRETRELVLKTLC